MSQHRGIIVWRAFSDNVLMLYILCTYLFSSFIAIKLHCVNLNK